MDIDIYLFRFCLIPSAKQQTLPKKVTITNFDTNIQIPAAALPKTIVLLKSISLSIYFCVTNLVG